MHWNIKLLSRAVWESELPLMGQPIVVTSVSVPQWNYSISSSKTIFNHENCFKARKQNARTLSCKTATDHKTHFRKKHHEIQYNPMKQMFWQKTFLENIHWHTFNQLLLQNLMYTSIAIVTDIVVFWIPLFLLRATLPCVIQSKRNDSNKFSSWRVQVYFLVWIRDCGKT